MEFGPNSTAEIASVGGDFILNSVLDSILPEIQRHLRGSEDNFCKHNITYNPDEHALDENLSRTYLI